eukprot:MONOS_689.1-p1 / transcript=MONOS_689.1 / gene=MONOS_689 / organism=Monocercomonoides_exilis_PA203 / gene_product=leucine-rich repeat-containing protein C10orf11 / transcript_product=leucine-rich repeat-containing protein C10orf11 / location=Mono_scaffold00011:192540-193487(+) / protein_length=241 / sequence_SO=supercontig / SO=protein_coding / is_pseudo=false
MSLEEKKSDSSDSEKEEEFPEAEPVAGNLSVVGRGLTVLPDLYGKKYGSIVTSLDLSHNKLNSLDNIAPFVGLKSLILDNNELTDESEFPDLPKLETLWMNNNKIANIKLLLDRLRHCTPNLKYLSLLKNPACPNRLMGKDDDDYQRYRLYVLWRMPNLKFLDSGSVSTAEKQEAARRGEFCVPSAPLEISTSQAAIEGSIGATSDITESVPSSSTHFGVCRYYYQGKQSEGNRFIKNQML